MISIFFKWAAIFIVLLYFTLFLFAMRTPGMDPRIPVGMNYKPVVFSQPVAAVAPLLGVVSNAALTADHILRSKHYYIIDDLLKGGFQIGSIDWKQSTRWTISPYYRQQNNDVISQIQATVFRNAMMTQIDPAKSFTVTFDPSGVLETFFWKDNHEVFLHRSGGNYTYGCHVGSDLEMDVAWNANGELTHSNVWDLAQWRKAVHERRPYVPIRSRPVNP